MSKRFVVGVALAGAVLGAALFACSSSELHPATLSGCTGALGCGDLGKLDASSVDGTLDAPPNEAASPVDTGNDSALPADAADASNAG